MVQFYVMDLKAIADATEKDRSRGLVEWAEAFTASNWEEVRRIDNPGVKEAVKQMQTIMNTPAQRQLVWDRKRAQLDYDTQIAEAEFNVLAGLVKDGLLPITEAANRSGRTVASFAKKAGIHLDE